MDAMKQESGRSVQSILPKTDFNTFFIEFKNVFSIFSSQEIGSSLISLGMIFQALHSELFRFKFHSLGSKIKNPGIKPIHRFRLNRRRGIRIFWTKVATEIPSKSIFTLQRPPNFDSKDPSVSASEGSQV